MVDSSVEPWYETYDDGESVTSIIELLGNLAERNQVQGLAIYVVEERGTSMVKVGLARTGQLEMVHTIMRGCTVDIWHLYIQPACYNAGKVVKKIDSLLYRHRNIRAGCSCSRSECTYYQVPFPTVVMAVQLSCERIELLDKLRLLMDEQFPCGHTVSQNSLSCSATTSMLANATTVSASPRLLPVIGDIEGIDARIVEQLGRADYDILQEVGSAFSTVPDTTGQRMFCAANYDSQEITINNGVS